MVDDSSIARVAALLRSEAATLRPGDRLASTREVAARHGVGPVTVGRALARLVAEGTVVTEPGRGTFVAARPAPAPMDSGWQTVALGDARVDAADLERLVAVPEPAALVLSSGYLSEDLQPGGALTAATVRAARRPGAWSRTAPAGLPELRTIFAGQLGVEQADVIVVPGGQAGLSAALRALAPPGAPVLVEVPTYLGALAAARAAGLRPHPVPTDRHGLRVDLLVEAFTRTGAGLLYAQPTYANPTGAVLSPDRRRGVLDAVRAAGAFLLEDDWARHLALDGTPPPPLLDDDVAGHVVHLTSLTKPVAPSLRVGALVARGPAAARLRAVRTTDDLFVSRILQEVAVELLGSPAWPRHLAALRARLRDRRDTLLAAVRSHLPMLTVDAVPRGGLHLWGRLAPGLDDHEVAERARRDGVVVEAGRPYFVTEPPGSYLRLTYAGTGPGELTDAVRRLAATLG